MIVLCVCLCAAAIGNSPAKTTSTSIDLLADVSTWSTWAHRPEISPEFRAEPDRGSEKTSVLVIETKKDRAACGCWRRELPTLKNGRRYILEAAFEAESVDSVNHNVWAILSRGDREFMELAHQGIHDGLHRMRLRIEPDEDWSGLRLCLYNTGVLIDREGRIIGKYRKTHLTIGEALLSGKTPGNSYPVFETDFGRVGYMICYDNHFPEVARALAIQGAEVIVFSNMGDGREKGILWEPYMQTRALDNQVHIVAAVNGGRSCIVSPRGEILSIVDKTRGAIAIARCDLDVTVRNYSGRQIGKRYMQVRRSDTFDILGHEYRQEKPRTSAEQ